MEADPDRDAPNRLMLWTESLRVASFGGVASMAGTLAIFGLAWLARVLVNDALPPGFPYVTFFPAVILTAFLFGVRFGALSALLCGLVAWYYFIAPIQSFKLAGAEVALGLYLFVVATDLALIHGLQAANRQLRDERQTSLDLAAAKEQAAQELQERAAELRQALDDLRDSDVKTHLATQTAGIGIWQWHVPTDAVHWDSTMFALYGLSPTADGSVRYSDYIERVHPDDAAMQDNVLQQTVADCAESSREFRIRRGDDGQVRHLRAVEVARAGADGRTEWVVGTNLDITEQKDRESHVRILLSEVNHRAKNLLAVVLSVAKRTSWADHETFMTNFAARLHSLSAGQDLLVKNAWRGVGLHALVSAQLGHFADLIGTRIVLEGHDLPLSPSAVQTLGMTVHELVTNASKYGALSSDRGQVTLSWRRVKGPRGPRFVMTWTESGGPVVAPPQRSGFGSIVTVDMVRTSLDAEVESAFALDGFSWRLDCALDIIVEQETS